MSNGLEHLVIARQWIFQVEIHTACLKEYCYLWDISVKGL